MKACLAIGVIAGFISYAFIQNYFVAILSAFVIFNVLGGWKYTRTLPRDLYGFYILLSVKRIIESINSKNTTVVQCFEQTVEKSPQRPMFNFEGNVKTFEVVNDRAEQIATFFQKAGVKKEECVALVLENSPDLVVFWLGLAKIGATSALINFNLRQKSLGHSLKVCDATFVVCSKSLLPNVLEIKDELKPEAIFYVLEEEYPCYKSEDQVEYSETVINLNEKLRNVEIGYVRPNVSINDRLIYIYTSGTTGFPKAAKISNYRFMYMAKTVGYLNKITHNDVIWTPLPLYHSNAGILGVGQCIFEGSCVSFRRKFSASKFWKDVVESQATIFQYLGEICRYVYKQAPCPEEIQHRLRTIIGNGLKKSLWADFITRYKIPHVCEIYGSTEGNCNLANLDETPGACGFLSIIFSPKILKNYLLRCDDQGNLFRDDHGLCIVAKPGEQGHLVGEINKSDSTKKFEGYLGAKETSKKIAENILRHGDKVFLSGDILHMDEYGYLYFKDRTGDTFRWKGENVSTCEVESAIVPAVDHR